MDNDNITIYSLHMMSIVKLYGIFRPFLPYLAKEPLSGTLSFANIIRLHSDKVQYLTYSIYIVRMLSNMPSSVKLEDKNLEFQRWYQEFIKISVKWGIQIAIITPVQ
jgi:hypothetical protein